MRYKSWNYFPGEATYHLYRGEALLEMAIGKEKPPMAVLKKNLWFLLRTAPFAASMARRHLQSAVGLFKHYDMPVLESWALFDLARLDAAKKRRNEAMSTLETSRALAEKGGEPGLIERIDALSAELRAA